MSRTIRWGVLGTANIARAAVNPAIQASANGQLVAVASRDLDRARAFAAAGNIPGSYGSYQELLNDPRIDAVYIPLPNNLHRLWAIRAAEAGKHILCEKPLALTAVECAEMEAAATASRVLLMEAFMYRFHPRTVEFVKRIRQGAVGQLKVVRSAFTFRLASPTNIRLRPELGGGALMDVGCYCVNASRTLADEEPVEAVALARWAPSGVDEQLTGILRFPGGAVAQFDCALTMERREICEAAGTEGALSVDAAFLPGGGPVSIEERRGRAATTRHEVGRADQYQVMVEHFADCILTGAPVRYPPAEAAANLRAIEALYRSARAAGRPEPV